MTSMSRRCLSCANEYGAGMASCPKCGNSTSHMVGEEALDYLQAQLKSKALNDRGVRLFQQGKLNEAEAELRKAIEVHPEHEMAYANLGFVLIERGQLRDAVKTLEKVLAMNPHREDAQRHLAKAREALAREAREMATDRSDEARPSFWKRIFGRSPPARSATKPTPEVLAFDSLEHVVLFAKENLQSFSPSSAMKRVFEEMTGRAIQEVSRKARLQLFRNSSEATQKAEKGNAAKIAAFELGSLLGDSDLPMRLLTGRVKAVERYFRDPDTNGEFVIVLLYRSDS